MLRFLDRLQPLGVLVLRLVLGAVMVAHGYPKVVGSMGKQVEYVRSLHLPGQLAYLSAGTEFFGGALLILGLMTRFAAVAVAINMGVAIWKVHWKHGFVGPNNYQFPLALGAIAFALIWFGAGPLSLDRLFSSRPAPKKK